LKAKIAIESADKKKICFGICWQKLNLLTRNILLHNRLHKKSTTAGDGKILKHCLPNE
jgi:hypothetical protein